MTRRIKISIFLFLIFIFMGNASPAAALYPAKQADYQIELQGDLVFVMFGVEVDWRIEEPALRSNYSQSGLYNIHNPNEPLWTIDWYAYRSLINISQNGEYLVHFGIWQDEPDDMAFEIYRHGTRQTQFLMLDLYDEPEQLFNGAGYYDWVLAYATNGSFSTLTILTYHLEHIQINIQSGELIRKDSLEQENIFYRHFHDGISHRIYMDRYIYQRFHRNIAVVLISQTGKTTLPDIELTFDDIIQNSDRFPVQYTFFYDWLDYYRVDKSADVLYLYLNSDEVITINLETNEVTRRFLRPIGYK